MPIKIGKKTTSEPATDTTPETPAQTAPANPQKSDLTTLGTGTSQPATQPAPDAPGTNPAPQPAPGSGVHFSTPKPTAAFLMTGSSQQSTVAQVKAFQDLRAKMRGGAREFWLNPGEFARLYFLDGTLIGDGVWDTPMVAIHMMQIGGEWVRFICTEKIEGQCLACASNVDGSQPQTLQLFTVINTQPYVVKGGPNKGTLLPARLQLFPANLKTREKLVHKAANRGNALAGKLWQFSRSTKQDSRTGDDIEYIDAYPMQAVVAKYPKLGDNNTPTSTIDYNTAYAVLTNAELAGLRPDVAHSAGWTGPVGHIQAPVAGATSSVGSLGDDEIPF